MTYWVIRFAVVGFNLQIASLVLDIKRLTSAISLLFVQRLFLKNMLLLVAYSGIDECLIVLCDWLSFSSRLNSFQL